MFTKLFRRACLMAALVSLAFAGSSSAQCCSSGGCAKAGDKPSSRSGGGGPYEPPKPEPYGGQVFCPVTGKKLGLDTPPVPVQTTIGEKKPSLAGKMFGKKPTPGAIVYVCCPDCVAKVQSNPNLYQMEMIADKGAFSYTYASAPAKRPYRVRGEASGQQDAAQLAADKGNVSRSVEVLKASAK